MMTELDQETAFSLLADETRVRIVRELGAATASPETGIPRLSYADLKSRVDIRDSGRFNYHLTKLVGKYVVKEDEGYRLRWPGMVLYRTLVAGLLTDEVDPAIGRFSVGTACHRCDEPIEAHLYETLFRVRCWSCNANYTDIYFPSHGLVDRSEEELLQAVHRRSRTILDSMTAGQCPWCASEVTAEIHETDGSLPSLHDTRDLDTYVIYHCTDCTGFQYMPVSQVLLYHPVAIAFYHDRGKDLTAIPKWKLKWAVTDETTTIFDTDPWGFSVRIPLDGAELIAELDSDLDVVDSRLEPPESNK
jgi:hypothetical protein